VLKRSTLVLYRCEGPEITEVLFPVTACAVSMMAMWQR